MSSEESPLYKTANTATGDVPNFGRIGTGDIPSRPNKPSRVSGEYPVRNIVWYQFSSSDIRSIGVAQAASVISFSLGTWTLSEWLDFKKDIAQAALSKQPVSDFLQNLASAFFILWICFWAIGLIAFFWQGLELRRIKVEHGEMTVFQKIRNFWRVSR
jgi:hypothetical protein